MGKNKKTYHQKRNVAFLNFYLSLLPDFLRLLSKITNLQKRKGKREKRVEVR